LTRRAARLKKLVPFDRWSIFKKGAHLMKQGDCYNNGTFMPLDEAKVSILDRGFTSGEGVYDVTRSFGHKLFKLKDHVERLYRSLAYTHIRCDMPIDEMMRLSIDVFERNKPLLAPGDDVALWHVVTRGPVPLKRGSSPPTVVIYCVPVAFASFAQGYLDGIKLMIPSTRRTPPECLEAKAKVCNKMNHAIALYEAQQIDPRCIPLMLDVHGNISETNSSNFFFVANGTLCTSTDKNVLGGITRATVIELAREQGIPIVEGNFTPYDVYVADEAFVAGTSPTVLPVTSLNGSKIGNTLPGPVTVRLIKAFNELVGLDYVSQALSHIADADKQKALAEWHKRLG
jgi:branched-chain amino acid aminotransferase